MEKTEMVEKTITICDTCGEAEGFSSARELRKCIECGKDICSFCGIQVGNPHESVCFIVCPDHLSEKLQELMK